METDKKTYYVAKLIKTGLDKIDSIDIDKELISFHKEVETLPMIKEVIPTYSREISLHGDDLIKDVKSLRLECKVVLKDGYDVNDIPEFDIEYIK